MIRQAKLSHPELNINLVLIDPGFKDEYPASCVKEINAQQDNFFDNVYHSDDGVHIYVYDDRVKYTPQFASFETAHGTDITPLFSQMNQLCAENDGILIVQDYSGMEIDILATYFDKSIDKQHILYDMSCRSGISCLIDFTQIYCTIHVDETLDVFNPFMIDYFKLQDIYRQSFDDNVKQQIILCTQYHKNNFIKLYLYNLRKAKLWYLRRQSGQDANIIKRTILVNEVKMLDHLHETDLEQSLIRNDIDKYVNTIGNIFMYKCYDVGLIFHFDGYEIMKIILSIDEPNSQVTHVSQYIRNLHID
jgi:hypothetical protein